MSQVAHYRMPWSASEQAHVPVPRGVDPDEFRSRKATSECPLRDTARPERTIRQFKARVLLRQIQMKEASNG